MKMYKGFKIKITKDSELFDKKFEKYKIIGEKQQNEIQKELKEYEKNLREYIDKETGKINMKKLKNSWFLEIETSIFISHSHLDLDLALAFSGWIKEKYSIDVFLDCYAWGSSDELLKIIDEKYSIKNKEKKTYDYKKRNLTTSHIHSILFNSIMKAIYKNKYFFVLDTENSISGDKTDSAWIFSEIEVFSHYNRVLENFIKSINLEKKAYKEDYKGEFSFNDDWLIELKDIDLVEINNNFFTYLDNSWKKEMKKQKREEIVYFLEMMENM